MQENAEKVLFAIYTEANSKKPMMANVEQVLGLDRQAFNKAVNMLYTMGLISGVVVKFGDDDANPVLVSTENVVLTRKGARQVEAALGLDEGSLQIEKQQKMVGKAGERGWLEIKDMAARALEELLKQ